ncbi:MAG: hypothetical protein U0470_02750 [Anaerolineae bacterium]
MAGTGHVAAVLEDREPVRQPGLELVQRQLARPGGGEFDRQRNAVEAGADARDLGGVRIRRRVSGSGHGGSGAEQAGGVEVHQAGRRQFDAFGRQSHRGNGPRIPAVHAQLLAARRQHLESGRVYKQFADQGAGGTDDVLAVVDHQEHPLVGKEGREDVDDSAPRRLAESERAEDGLRHLPIIRHGGHLHEGRAVRVVGGQIVG